MNPVEREVALKLAEGAPPKCHTHLWVWRWDSMRTAAGLS